MINISKPDVNSGNVMVLFRVEGEYLGTVDVCSGFWV